MISALPSPTRTNARRAGHTFNGSKFWFKTRTWPFTAQSLYSKNRRIMRRGGKAVSHKIVSPARGVYNAKKRQKNRDRISMVKDRRGLRSGLKGSRGPMGRGGRGR